MRGPTQSNADPGPSPTGTAVRDGLQRHYGSMKAAALTLGMDQSQLTRELHRGDLRVRAVDALDAGGRAAVAKALSERFGDADPAAEVTRVLQETRARLEELSALVARQL